MIREIELNWEMLSSPSPLKNNKQKNLPLHLWFFVRITLHQFRNIVRNKKERNETNYKMPKEMFYLLRNVIARNTI